MIMNEITYILKMSYDGTKYYGWQKQPDVPTIQGELEKVLNKLWNVSIKTVGASRTDRGVHALDQCVSFSASQKFEPDELVKKLNLMLPQDISVRSAKISREKFNARFDACGKLYAYKIYFDKNPFKLRYSLWLNRHIETNEMEVIGELSELLIGEHNFSAFSIKKDLPENPVCNIKCAFWEFAYEKESIIFYINGDRFLHKMVRSLVGAILDIARGKFSPEIFKKMLDTGERIVEFKTASPKGLILEKVYYDEDFR